MADDDPWTDCRWGLITGSTPKDAMRLVQSRKPLIIRRALTTTGINLSLVDSALTLSDGEKGAFTRKLPGKTPETGTWNTSEQPTGTVNMFADYWNTQDPQLLVTSSHSTQFNLEMPFGLGLIASHGGKFHVLNMQQRNEFAKFLGGAMFTGKVDKLGQWIESTMAPTLTASNESCRVWMACGNCLIGDAMGTHHSMVVSALSSAGFRQFVGYVVPTWYGRAGWGTSSLWQGSQGALSLAEAFFLNTQGLIDETITRFPGAEKINFDADDIQLGMKSDREFIDGLNRLMPILKPSKNDQKDLLGLIHDRDVLAFWGDPLWEARFDPTLKPHPLKHSWKTAAKSLTLTLTANADFEGAYPLWLPQRIPAAGLSIPAGVKLDALATEDFILIRKLTLKKGETLRLDIGSRP
jgi:zinc protease